MDGTRGEKSSHDGSGWGPVVTGFVALLVAGAGWMAAEAISGVLKVSIDLVALLAGGYAAYTLGLVLMFLVIARIIDSLDRDDGIPWFVWVGLLILVPSWALWAGLAGYDSAEWCWSGTAVATASFLMVLVFSRR